MDENVDDGRASAGRPPSEEIEPPSRHDGTLPQDRVTTIRRRLLDAYDEERRDLPWRGEADPYRIWVSEVMLQQTRVETVLPYYMKWMDRFPSVEALAGAEEEDVLKMWEGLGYYSRARRLHRAAKVIRETYGGSLPASMDGLKALPGVGEYTAGAVASMAFGKREPAVDGNVRRVLSRLFDLPDPSPTGLRALAAELVDPDRPGDFNQALMELGALVCTPRSPDCPGCPLSDLCLALTRGTVEDRPPRKERRPVPEADVVTVVAARLPGPRLLLRKRPGTGLLAGMWEFPGAEVTPAKDDGVPQGGIGDGDWREEAEKLASDLGLAGGDGLRPMETVAHAFSHLKVRYRPFLEVTHPDDRSGTVESEGCRWVKLEELEGLPLPVAQEKILTAALERLDPELLEWRPWKDRG